MFIAPANLSICETETEKAFFFIFSVIRSLNRLETVTLTRRCADNGFVVVLRYDSAFGHWHNHTNWTGTQWSFASLNFVANICRSNHYSLTKICNRIRMIQFSTKKKVKFNCFTIGIDRNTKRLTQFIELIFNLIIFQLLCKCQCLFGIYCFDSDTKYTKLSSGDNFSLQKCFFFFSSTDFMTDSWRSRTKVDLHRSQKTWTVWWIIAGTTAIEAQAPGIESSSNCAGLLDWIWVSSNIINWMWYMLRRNYFKRALQSPFIAELFSIVR